MKVISVMSPKGGIGKTTTADSVAYILGNEGKKVILLEGDPQGDTSRTYGCYDPEGIGMSELLERLVSRGGDYTTTELIQETPYSNVSIISGNGYLRQTDKILGELKKENQADRLRLALEEIHADFDYCICDCGRLFDNVVINMIVASDIVIVPVKVGGYEAVALSLIQEQIEDLKKLNPEYENIRIKAVMTMRQKNRTSLDAEYWLKTESGCEVYNTAIRRSIITEKASMILKPLPAFLRNSLVTQDYRNLVNEIMEDMEE